MQYDPRALSLLDRMAAAYAQLPALEQRTEFYSVLVPFALPNNPFGVPPPPTKDEEAKAPKPVKSNRILRLSYAAPNRLRLDAEEGGAKEGRTAVTQWVSDGRAFWTFQPEKNWYTRDKAPARFADFRRLPNLNTGTLELLMLMGVNPFADLRGQADSVTLGESETVQGIPTEVVVMRSVTRYAETEARLFIGKDDLLLRRVVTQNTPIVGPTVPGKVGDALDELVDDAQPRQPGDIDPTLSDAPPLLSAPAPPPAAQNTTPNRTRTIYENIITPNPTFDRDTFHFTIPTGAWLYGDGGQKTKKRGIPPLLRRKRPHIIRS